MAKDIRIEFFKDRDLETLKTSVNDFLESLDDNEVGVPQLSIDAGLNADTYVVMVTVTTTWL